MTPAVPLPADWRPDPRSRAVRCQAPGCRSRSAVRGLCRTHYDHAVKRGLIVCRRQRLLPAPQRGWRLDLHPRPGGLCSVDDCPALAVIRGACKSHYASIQRRSRAVPFDPRAVAIWEAAPRPPATRAGCAALPRPCTCLRCRYHMGYGLAESCVLDVADRGGVTLEEIGDLFGIARERIRQVEAKAFEKIHRRRPVLRSFTTPGKRVRRLAP